MSFVSQNIQRLRLKRKLSQEEIAKRLLVSEQTLADWENGDSLPDIDTLVKIAEALNTDVQTLVDEHHPKTRKKAIAQLLAALGILLILGIASCIFAPIGDKMRGSYYIIAPSLIVRGYIMPFFWFVLGWTAVHILSMLGVKKPVRSKFSKPIHVAVLTIVVIYAILMLPFVIEQIIYLARFLQAQQNPSLYPNGFQFTSNLPNLLSTIEWYVLTAVYKQPIMFVLPGIIYRLSKHPYTKRRLPPPQE